MISQLPQEYVVLVLASVLLEVCYDFDEALDTHLYLLLCLILRFQVGNHKSDIRHLKVECAQVIANSLLILIDVCH